VTVEGGVADGLSLPLCPQSAQLIAGIIQEIESFKQALYEDPSR
jgi:hypothetical protein